MKRKDNRLPPELRCRVRYCPYRIQRDRLCPTHLILSNPDKATPENRKAAIKIDHALKAQR